MWIREAKAQHPLKMLMHNRNSTRIPDTEGCVSNVWRNDSFYAQPVMAAASELGHMLAARQSWSRS